MSHAIICEDYLNVVIPAGSVHLVVTSPPYPGLRGCRLTHSQWLDWFARVLLKLYGEMSSEGVLCLNVGAARVEGAALSAEFYANLIGLFRGWHWVDWVAWDKTNPAPSGSQRAGRRYDLQAWESVYVLAKSAGYTYQAQYAPYATKTRQKAHAGALRSPGVAGHYAGGHNNLSHNGAYQTNVWRISPSGGRSIRPRAQGQSFPVELAWRLISTYSYHNDLVLDPFCGAGTTCYAAKTLGRRWLGVDIDDHACELVRAWLCSHSRSQLNESDQVPGKTD